MKTAAGRPKDLGDIEELEAILRLRSDELGPLERAARGLEALARLGRQRGDDLGRRRLAGELVGLARPQVDHVGVAGRAAGGAQRRGDVVDLGIGERRVGGVLAQEAVDDAARLAAGEGARQARRACRRRAPPGARARCPPPGSA